MKNEFDEFDELIQKIEENTEKTNELIKVLMAKNKALQDEVDSLWAMMDEITKSDIENWSSILEDIEKDVLVRSLMVTKKKALA